MKKVLVAVVLALAAVLTGCRLGRYRVSEPVSTRALEVKSGDYWTVELDTPEGTRWRAVSDDTDVGVSYRHFAADPPRPAQTAVRLEVRSGFTGPAEVTLVNAGPRGEERRITFFLYTHPEHHAFWK